MVSRRDELRLLLFDHGKLLSKSGLFLIRIHSLYVLDLHSKNIQKRSRSDVTMGHYLHIEI